MRWLLPTSLVGAMAGFILGFMVSLNLGYLGIDGTGWPTIIFGILGAVVGYMVGASFHSPSARTRTVARWCVATAVALGAVSFLAGFAGPIILRPDLPQGPMLGIFCTGPLGTLLGAIVGALIGLWIPSPSTSPTNRSLLHPSS